MIRVNILILLVVTAVTICSCSGSDDLKDTILDLENGCKEPLAVTVKVNPLWHTVEFRCGAIEGFR